jgi:ribosome biogenesis GTPase
MIERIEPRQGVLSRKSRGRQHVLVANVEQLMIVSSAAQPALKPHLIDRLLAAAEYARISPVICINKIDLVDSAEWQPLFGAYGQLGYRVLLTSVTTGQGMDQVRQLLTGQHTAITGQSGVGKTSLLNAVQPGLGLRVREVSRDNEKGRHTTTNAMVVPLANGGWVVDTPGIRQFQLWDVTPAELAGLFRDLRPYVSQCRFPNCTHTHEDDCAVKSAVADHRLDLRRYESFCHLQAED